MDWTQRFEENQARLRDVAFRMLGSRAEADDAVQESWLRLHRSDTGGVDDLGRWLTTVVARVCIDLLRSRKRVPLEDPPAPVEPHNALLLADSIGPALLIVLETLPPAERVAFVLHDMFDVSFDEIAGIVGRTSVAARQLASRGRRRIQGGPAVPEADLKRHQQVVGAFLDASRNGDFEGLLALLAPEALMRADAASVAEAASNQWAADSALALSREVRGAAMVAETMKGRARGAREAIVDGDAGAVWAVGGKARAAFVFTVDGGKVVEIALVMEPAQLGQLVLVF